MAAPFESPRQSPPRIEAHFAKTLLLDRNPPAAVFFIMNAADDISPSSRNPPMQKTAAYIIEKPTLCLVVGVPASGKTALARELARVLMNSAYLSKDLIQTPFTSSERVTGSVYSLVQGPTFQILVDFADIQLGLGKTPIIDAPFSINHGRNDKCRDWVPPFKNAAQKYGARLAIVRCLPPSEAILKARIEERLKRNESKWDGWKLDHWADFLKSEPLHFPIAHDDVHEFLSDELFENRVEGVLKNYLGAEAFPPEVKAGGGSGRL